MGKVSFRLKSAYLSVVGTASFHEMGIRAHYKVPHKMGREKKRWMKNQCMYYVIILFLKFKCIKFGFIIHTK